MYNKSNLFSENINFDGFISEKIVRDVDFFFNKQKSNIYLFNDLDVNGDITINKKNHTGFINILGINNAITKKYFNMINIKMKGNYNIIELNNIYAKKYNINNISIAPTDEYTISKNSNIYFEKIEKYIKEKTSKKNKAYTFLYFNKVKSTKKINLNNIKYNIIFFKDCELNNLILSCQNGILIFAVNCNLKNISINIF